MVASDQNDVVLFHLTPGSTLDILAVLGGVVLDFTNELVHATDGATGKMPLSHFYRVAGLHRHFFGVDLLPVSVLRKTDR